MGAKTMNKTKGMVITKVRVAKDMQWGRDTPRASGTMCYNMGDDYVVFL